MKRICRLSASRIQSFVTDKVASLIWRQKRSCRDLLKTAESHCQSGCEHHSASLFHFSFLWPSLTLSLCFTSPLRDYLSITNGDSNDVCQQSFSLRFSLSYTNSPPVLLLCHFCRSQSFVRHILINWLLVDVSVAYFEMAPKLSALELVREQLQ